MFYKAVFFDLDGTLVDSHEAHWSAVITTARSLGFSIPDNVKDIQHIVGGTYYRFFSYFIMRDKRAKGDRHCHELAMRFSELASRSYHRNWISAVKCYPGVTELLQRVAPLYEKVGLVTSSDRTTVDLTLRHLGLDRFFCVTVTKDDVSTHKPHPMPYIEAAQRAGVSPQQSVAVEDARVGVFSARMAEMLTVGILTSESHTTLRDSGAHRIVKDHAELTALLEALKRPHTEIKI